MPSRQPGVDRTKIQSEITELQNQLQSIADSAVFSGENWLSTDSSAAGYNATKSIVSSFSRTEWKHNHRHDFRGCHRPDIL